MTDGTTQARSEGTAQTVTSAELAADPRMRRIERDHALLGGACFVAGLVVATVPEALSFAFGWGVIASSLWVWKRVAILVFSAGPSRAGGLGVRVLAKGVLTFVALLAVVQLVEIEILPMLMGGGVLPLVLLVEAMRSGFGAEAPAAGHGPAA